MPGAWARFNQRLEDWMKLLGLIAVFGFVLAGVVGLLLIGIRAL